MVIYLYTIIFSFTPLKTKKNKSKIDRGQLLRKAVESSDITVQSLMQKLKYASRNSYYGHTRNPDLSLDMLKKYGKILNYDFSRDIPEMEPYIAILGDPEIGYMKEPKTKEEAVKQRDFYIKLYMNQLEEFRRLQEEMSIIKEKKDK